MATTNGTTVAHDFDSISKSSFNSDAERRAALKAARELCIRLERPWDTIIQSTWIQPGVILAARIGVNLGLFEKLKEGSKTNEELANATNADPMLVGRLLKHMAAAGYLVEDGPNTYSNSEFTTGLTDPLLNSGMDFLYDILWPAYLKTPEYLAKEGYKNPLDPFNGPWQYTTNAPGDHFFEWCKKHPQEHSNFIRLMTGYTSDRESWVDVYPSEKLLETAEPEGVVLVDVGGNVGTDLERYLAKNPAAAGRVVLEDQAHVLATAKIDDRIKAISHDFFIEQPIKGARAYFLHSILHDWSDDLCRSILENLKPAMKKGYSRILLSENVIPPTNAHPQTTAMDLIMMSVVSTIERTRDMWTKLLESAGYKVVNIYLGRIESVIEAELA